MSGRLPVSSCLTKLWSIFSVFEWENAGDRTNDGKAGAEIIQGEAGAEFLDLLKDLGGIFRVFHHQRFG